MSTGPRSVLTAAAELPTHRPRVLGALQSADGFLSGAALAKSLGITRAAVWKNIEVLRRQGYDIQSARTRGYRLFAAPDVLRAEGIACLAAQSRFGAHITVLDITGSTNADVLTLARGGAPEGTVVIAEQQTAGRGRLGRTWESAAGLNLYMSALLRPRIVPAAAPQLALVAGVAVAETIAEEGVDCGIKWPNDVVVRGKNGLRKLAGILTEIEAETDRVSAIVAGIGVNLNSEARHFSDDLAGKATSVRMETGRAVDRVAFTARLLVRLDALYADYLDMGFAAAAPRWNGLSVLHGRRVDIGGAGPAMSGVCVGIDNDGALLLQTEPGAAPRRVLAGDVTVQGGYD